MTPTPNFTVVSVDGGVTSGTGTLEAVGTFFEAAGDDLTDAVFRASISSTPSE